MFLLAAIMKEPLFFRLQFGQFISMKKHFSESKNQVSRESK